MYFMHINLSGLLVLLFHKLMIYFSLFIMGGDTSVAEVAPFANMDRQHIIIASVTLALASSGNFYNVLNKLQ